MKKTHLYFCIFTFTQFISFAPKTFSQEQEILTVVPVLETFLLTSAKENSVWKNQAAEYEQIRDFRNSDPLINCQDIYLKTAGAITSGKWDVIFPEHKVHLTPSFLKTLKEKSKIIEKQSQLAKEYFKRLRPYKDQNTANGTAYAPCSDSVFTSGLLNSSKFYSFPSTHSVQARVAALYLAFQISSTEVLKSPETFLIQNSDILKQGSLMALHRVLAGHHYPTDILAGEAVADSLFCKTFKEDLPKKLVLDKCEEILFYVHQSGGLKAIGPRANWAITFY